MKAIRKLSVIALLAVFGLCGAAWAKSSSSIEYLDWDYENNVMTNAVCEAYTLVKPDTATLESGWWVVDEAITNTTGGIVVSGDAHLILADDAELVVTGLSTKAGIDVSVSGSTTNSLAVYGQMQGTGRLMASAYYNNNEAGGSGIGCGVGGRWEGLTAGTITINGGIVMATGGRFGAGIGGGHYGGGGTITINGGAVNATCLHSGAGIGGGSGGDAGTITINGGTVTAHGEVGGPGIGSGRYCYDPNGSVTINGGQITATTTGSWGAEAIGKAGESPGTPLQLMFGPDFQGGVAAGNNAENAVFWTTTAYTNDHSATYVKIPASVLAITNVEGLVYMVTDSGKTINPNVVDGVSYYLTTNHATLTVGFALAPGYIYAFGQTFDNPKTASDILDITSFPVEYLPRAVLPVAQIVRDGGATTKLFDTLQNAFDSELLDDPAVTNTIKVLQAVALQGPIGLPICDGEGGLTNVTARLDLNGKTITVPTGAALMTVASGATVIIDDSSAEGTGVIEKAEPMGEFDWTAMVDMAVVSIFEGGKLTLANGTLKSAPEWQDEAPEGQYDSVGVVNLLGEFTMTGGAIVDKDSTWPGDKVAIYSYGDNVLTGGKVKGEIRFESDEGFGSMSISGGVFGTSDVFDHPDWVAEGYACDENADEATLAEGYPWAVFFATDGSKWNPWNVGPEGSDLPQAYTNRNGELVIEGPGTVVKKPWLDEGVKEVVNAIAPKDPETELPEGAFEGLGSDGEKIELKLPDNWKGELPDEDGNWYGAKVKVTIWPYMVHNVSFQQRYPWNGLVDITADVYGPEDIVKIRVSATKGLEALPVSTLEGESTVGLTNGPTQVKFVWNADADVGPQAARLENVRVNVTQTLLEADVDSAVLVERTEPGVTLNENGVVVGAKCDGEGYLEIPAMAKGLAEGVLANPEIKVVNFLSYKTAINLHAWDKSGFSATDVPQVKVGGTVPAAYYRSNGGTYANIATAIAYHWLAGVDMVRSVPFDQCGTSGEAEAGWLDLAKGTVRVARDSEIITADPAWGGASVANVGWPGEDTDRSYTAAAKETWDTTAVESGRRYDFAFKAEKGPGEVLTYAASFWKLGDGWQVLDHSNVDADTRLDDETTYLVIGETVVGEGIRLVIPNGTRFVFDEGSGFRPAADSVIVAPAYAQLTNDVTGVVTLKLLPQPVVANMKFLQRYPWNGIVDITFDLSTDQDTEAAPVAATYNVKLTADINGTTRALQTAGTEDGTPLSDGLFRAPTGKVHVIWDAAADYPERPKGVLKVKVDVSVGDL